MTTSTVQTTLDGEQAREPHKDPELLRELYHDRGLSLRQIADELDCHYTTVHEYMERYDIDRREAVYDPDPDGYAPFIQHNDGYEGWVDCSRIVLVHRLVAVSEHGFDAVVDGIVHHENGIKWDNRPENLAVCESHQEHQREHSRPSVDDDRQVRFTF